MARREKPKKTFKQKLKKDAMVGGGLYLGADMAGAKFMHYHHTKVAEAHKAAAYDSMKRGNVDDAWAHKMAYHANKAEANKYAIRNTAKRIGIDARNTAGKAAGSKQAKTFARKVGVGAGKTIRTAGKVSRAARKTFGAVSKGAKVASKVKV